MNEHIKLLKEQAMEWVPNMADPDTKIRLLNAEKFALLIVQECAGLFVDQKYMILNPHEPFANERVRALKEHDKDTVRKIREHFGVEE
jgi:hypothetical protein